MPYTVTWNTNVSTVIDALPFGVSKNSSFTVSSSNAIQQTVTLATGSWTQLSLGGLSNVFSIGLFNDNAVNTASIIQVSTGSAGQYVLTTLQPGQTSQIAWSGSLNGLYASVTSGSGPVGTIQYYVQQA